MMIGKNFERPSSEPDVRTAAVSDTVTVRVHATDFTNAQSYPYVVLANIVPTGATVPPFSPTLPLYVDLMAPIVVFRDSNSNPSFPELLTENGVGFDLQIPFGLNGFSMLLQSAALDSNAMNSVAAISDAYELTIL